MIASVLSGYLSECMRALFLVVSTVPNTSQSAESLQALVTRFEKTLTELTKGKASPVRSSRSRSSSKDTTEVNPRKDRKPPRREVAYSSSESEEEKKGGIKRKSQHARGLPDYDGSNMPLERFLHKFRTCTNHYGWDKEERRFHLVSVMIGTPGDIAQAGGDDITERQLIKELKLRFGNASRNRAYRTQLEALRQTQGQSIQELYNEVTRLLSLSYPGVDNETVESIGCNAFYRALTDQDLSKDLQVQDPEGLSEALTIALKLEPIFKASVEKRKVSEDSKRNVRVVEAEEDDVDVRSQLKRTQKELVDQKRSTESWKARAQKTTTRSQTESFQDQPAQSGAVGTLTVHPQAPSQVPTMVSPVTQASPTQPPTQMVFQQPLYANQGQYMPVQYIPQTQCDYQYLAQPSYQPGYQRGYQRGGRSRGNGGRGQDAEEVSRGAGPVVH